MSSSGEGALPEVPSVRAADADRERVIDRLRTAAADGALDLDELEQRLGHAYAARSLAELATLTADLPAPVAPTPVDPPRSRGAIALDDDEFRQHATVYAAVIGMLVVIWLLSGGGHPWPLYPAMGWGIGLVSHMQVAYTRQRKQVTAGTADGSRATPTSLPAPAPAQPDARSAGPTAPDRSSTRFVVAMFVDVVGSTSLNEELGDERWATVRRTFRSVVAEAVTAHGGWEVSTSGDGVLARFDAPTGAADAAIEILRRLGSQRAETGFAPSVRVGVHSGDAVEDGGDIIGNVVTLACRVCDAAEPDEVLITEHVADHLDRRHRTEGRGLHTLKGLARPRHLLALDWR